MSDRPSHPELLFLASRCYLGGPRWHATQALAIKGGYVCATGSRRSLLSRRSRRTRVIDLGRGVITPGLIDAHTHFVSWAVGAELVVELSETRSLGEALALLRAHAQRNRIGDWIVGRGFDYNRWGGDFPSCADLDRAVPDTPAIVHSRDGHTVWLNSAGLRLAGITAQTPDPIGGRFLRDAHGQPSGIAQEAAVKQLPDPLRDLTHHADLPSQRLLDRAVDAATRRLWALGIVGLGVMEEAGSWWHLQRRRANGTLGLRVSHAIPLSNLSAACQLGLRSGLGDSWLKVGGLKIFSDGALGSQTAYMFDAYPGNEGRCGVPVLAGEELTDTVTKAARAGWAAWIHAIGDHAVHDAAAAIASARSESGDLPVPYRIEHAQCVRPADIRLMARAGIVASVQPCHILGDSATADRHWPRARRYAYPFRQLIDAGVTLAAGSDVPIESPDPRRGLFAATVRTDENGQPPGGWFPRQRLTAAEVLDAYTRGAAQAGGWPAPAGTIAVGAPADLTLWGEDPLKIPPTELRGVEIRGCVVDGQPHLSDDA